jgi:multidrug resistance efflux pump
MIELEQAQLNLYYTEIPAPDHGVIESFNVDSGYYCQAGQPIATLISSESVWLQADMRENNISNISIGDSVWYIFDIAPGQIFKGHVRSIGYGVKEGNTTNRGDLPSISSSKGWLRDPQRFPVIVDIEDPAVTGYLRIGGQADVIVFTDHDHPILNTIGKWQIEIASWLSYVR